MPQQPRKTEDPHFCCRMLLPLVGFYDGTSPCGSVSQYMKSGCVAKQSIALPLLTYAYCNVLSLYFFSARRADLGRSDLQSVPHAQIRANLLAKARHDRWPLEDHSRSMVFWMA
jgi:hypothetical protein